MAGSCTATPTGSTAPAGRRTHDRLRAAAARRFDAEHALRKALDVVSYGLAHDLLRSPAAPDRAARLRPATARSGRQVPVPASKVDG